MDGKDRKGEGVETDRENERNKEREKQREKEKEEEKKKEAQTFPYLAILSYVQ